MSAAQQFLRLRRLRRLTRFSIHLVAFVRIPLGCLIIHLTSLMNYYLFSLCLILLCSIVKTSPVGHDGTEDDNLESRRSEDVTTTHPTFTGSSQQGPYCRTLDVDQ